MPELRAFIADGAGSSSDAFCVLAGMLSTPEGWSGFAEDWRKTLGSQSGRIFTASEANQKMTGLLDVIHKHPIYRLDSVTKRMNYERAVRDQVPEEIDSVQFVLFFNLVLGACKLMDLENLNGTVDFIFEAHETMRQDETLRWYRWMKDNPLVGEQIRNRLGAEPVFTTSEADLPLESAELYAAQVRHFFCDDVPNRRRPNQWLNSLGKIYGVSSYVEQKDVATLVYSIQHGLRLDAHCGPAAGFLGFSPDPIQA